MAKRPRAAKPLTPKEWRSIRRVEDFRTVLGNPGRAALVWFAVACLARIRHLLVPDAIQLVDPVEAYAEGCLDRPAVLEAVRAFIQAHYAPHIVRDQGDTEDIDIGGFDSPGSEAVAGAAGLVVGDLIDPEDERFHSTRGMFWLAQGMAESCRHAVTATIPDVPWQQEELPPNLEPFRAALLALPPGQLRQLWRTPELDPTLHAVYEPPFDAEWLAEVKRRAARIDSGEGKLSSWAEVRDRARRSVGGETMPETQFRKGDRVWFRFGTCFVQGEVKEDRGPIGIKGRHLYLVEFPLGRHAVTLSQIELPADQLESLQASAALD